MNFTNNQTKQTQNNLVIDILDTDQLKTKGNVYSKLLIYSDMVMLCNNENLHTRLGAPVSSKDNMGIEELGPHDPPQY